MVENIKNRKIYRICTDASKKIWDRINFLTNATSVDANDGDSLETKVGAIKGITADTNITTTGFAADATAVKKLNDRLGIDIKLINGVPNWSQRGADTWSPFKSGGKINLYGMHYGNLYRESTKPMIIMLNKEYTKISGIIPNLYSGLSSTYGYNQIAIVKNSGYTSTSELYSNLTINNPNSNGATRYVSGINKGTIENLVLQQKTGANYDNLIPNGGFNITDAEFLIVACSTYFNGDSNSTYDIVIE